jgi:hypothetical protein
MVLTFYRGLNQDKSSNGLYFDFASVFSSSFSGKIPCREFEIELLSTLICKYSFHGYIFSSLSFMSFNHCSVSGFLIFFLISTKPSIALSNSVFSLTSTVFDCVVDSVEVFVEPCFFGLPHFFQATYLFSLASI